MKSLVRIVLIFLGLAVLLIVGFFGYAIMNNKPISGLMISVQSPTEVRVGDKFDAIVSVSSTETGRKIDHLSFDNVYLSGFSIVAAEPLAAPMKGTPITLFPYDLAFNAGDKKTIKVTFKAERSGIYSGDVKVWYGFNNCTTRIQTLVK